MDSRQNIVLGIVVISIFIFLITVLVFAYTVSSEGMEVPGLLAPFMEYHSLFMVLMGVFGVGSGLLMYAILNATIERQKKAAKTNIGIIMKFLGPDERGVVGLLLEKEGQTTQSEIARLPGMSRLKAHRIVRKLEDRGVIHVEKFGKINQVRMVDELREGWAARHGGGRSAPE